MKQYGMMAITRCCVLLGLLLCCLNPAFTAPPEISSGLHAWYPLDGDRLDYSGNANDLSSLGSIETSIDAVAGSALSCDNRDPDQRAFLYRNINHTNTEPLSFSLWIKPSLMLNGYSRVSPHTLVNFYQVGSSNRFEIMIRNGQLYVEYASAVIPTGINLTTEQWAFVAVAISATNLTVYFNGSQVASQSISGLQAYNRLFIGMHANQGLGSRGYNGLIDDIHYFKRTLAPAEMQQLYQYRPAELGRDLFAYWRLNGDLLDDSGYEHPLSSLGTIDRNATGRFGKGCRLNNADPADGKRQLIYGNYSIEADQPLTICGWFKPESMEMGESTTAPHTLFRLWKVGESDDLRMQLRDGKIEVSYARDALILQTNITPSVGEWSFVALSIDDSKLSVYFNDQPAIVHPVSGLQEYDRVFIGLGDNQATVARGFNGVVDDVRLYTRRLFDHEIQALYMQHAPPDYLQEGLYGFWMLNDSFLSSTTEPRTLSTLGSLGFTSSSVYGHALYLENQNNDERDMAYLSDANPLIPPATPISLAMWVFPLSLEAGRIQTLAHFYSYGMGEDHSLRLEINDRRLGIYTTSTGTMVSNYYLEAGKWNYVGLRYTGVEISVQLNQRAPWRLPGGGYRSTGFNRMLLGLRANNSSEAYGFRGYLDHVRLYSRRLSDEEMQQLSLNDVGGILNDGGGYFNPWNTVRWADWYSQGKLTRPFVLNTSMRFAARTKPWKPNLSQVQPNQWLFSMAAGTQGKWLDGNGLSIDVSKTAYDNVDDLYRIGSGGYDSLIRGYSWGLMVSQNIRLSGPPTRVHNLEMRGFKHAFRVVTNHRHDLEIANVAALHNEWGCYFNGDNVSVISSRIAENARGGIYADDGSHALKLIENEFQDNDFGQAKTWGDIVFDASRGAEVRGNHFMPSRATTNPFRLGISMYRNMGEDGLLRENASSLLHIYDNHFDGYSMAMEMGGRMGFEKDDLSGESRDHVYDNIIESNVINNSTIGIKLNASGNQIARNEFANVDHPLVLHNIFYQLSNISINEQPGLPVRFWWDEDDTAPYTQWFPFNDDRHPVIAPEHKLIQLGTQGGEPTWPEESGAGQFLHSPSLLANNRPDRQYSALNLDPVDIAVGDFYPESPGDETAIIYSSPSSNINGTAYYTIVIVDASGNEIDRCGRSLLAWQCLAAGDFLADSGMEIAATGEATVNGYYPVYIFRRGHQEPALTLLAENTQPITDLAGGDFVLPGGGLDDVSILFSSPGTGLKVCSTENPGVAYSSSLPTPAQQIAGGDLDETVEGDELGALNTAGTQIALYSPAQNTLLQQFTFPAGAQCSGITTGQFDLSTPWQLELCGISDTSASAFQTLFFMRRGESSAYRTILLNFIEATIHGLGSGTFAPPAIPSPYDHMLKSGWDPEAMSGWGDRVIAFGSVATRTAVSDFYLYTGTCETPLSTPSRLIADRALSASSFYSMLLSPQPIQLNLRLPLLWLGFDPQDATKIAIRSTPLLP